MSLENKFVVYDSGSESSWENELQLNEDGKRNTSTTAPASEHSKQDSKPKFQGHLMTIHDDLLLCDGNNFRWPAYTDCLMKKILKHDMYLGCENEFDANHVIYTSLISTHGVEKSFFDVPQVANIFLNLGLHPPLGQVQGKYVTFCFKRPAASILKSYDYCESTRTLSEGIRQLMKKSIDQKKEIARFSLIEIKPNMYRPALFGSGNFGGSKIRFIRFPDYYIEASHSKDDIAIFKPQPATHHFTEHNGPCPGQMVFSHDQGKTHSKLMNDN